MVGCGEEYCWYPWDWMINRILLRMALFGATGVADNGEPTGENWG